MADPDYDVLLDNLRALTSDAEFTRPNLIAVVDVLAAHLGEALATKVGELEDGTDIEEEHPIARAETQSKPERECGDERHA